MFNVDSMSLLFAVFTLVANFVFAAILVSAVLSRGSRSGGPAPFLRDLAPIALPFAAAIAVVASLGSLWMSTGGNLLPCRFCWFQRTMMYPLGVMLPIAALRRDTSVAIYGWAIAFVGLLLSCYHYLIEWVPELGSDSCSATVPCTVPLFRRFGFMSLAYMAGSAFLAIIALLWVARTRSTHSRKLAASS
ncbi:MAG: disulfide bond formation protein B [Actinomycetia bacterium]|nr:disulfide bond formation protein B [Actinomycetes bacterium]MCP4961054.1 disulfide bond formation protein B [Actinomycetes bacterium]